MLGIAIPGKIPYNRIMMKSGYGAGQDGRGARHDAAPRPARDSAVVLSSLPSDASLAARAHRLIIRSACASTR